MQTFIFSVQQTHFDWYSQSTEVGYPALSLLAGETTTFIATTCCHSLENEYKQD